MLIPLRRKAKQRGRQALNARKSGNPARKGISKTTWGAEEIN